MEEIIKQILTNQQVIMSVLSKKCNEACKEMINYESGKTTELFARHKIDKTFYNSIYGNTAINYRKKVINKIEEERKKFIEKDKNVLNINEKIIYKEIIEFLANLEFEI